jgi:hypothetical protein
MEEFHMEQRADSSVHDRFLTTREASQRYKKSISWFEHRRVSGDPPFLKPDPTKPKSAVLYDRAELDKWFSSKTFTSTAEYSVCNKNALTGTAMNLT